jgi:amino acid transporter
VLYQTAYSEVGTALPLNGGTYNILLNTTNKLVAAIAASLTILSYTATAVVSANTAMTYAHLLWDKLNIIGATIGTLNTHTFTLLFPISTFTPSSALGFSHPQHSLLTVLPFVFWDPSHLMWYWPTISTIKIRLQHLPPSHLYMH